MFRSSINCSHIPRLISKNFPSVNKHPFVAYEYATDVKTSAFFKTSETNPVNLNESHLGRFYSIPDDVYQKLYTYYNGFTPEFRAQCQSFHEQCYLVRKPYLDLKKCIDSLDLEKPVVRFVIYGGEGFGKAMTMAGIVHYAYVKEFILVHQPFIPLWSRWTKDKLVPSVLLPEYFNHTIEAVAWLANFKIQNSELIEKLNLLTGNEYKWSLRETMPIGVPLLNIVEQGISRPAHAADCIFALVQELKQLSSQKKCKTMALVGAINGIYFNNHKHVTADRKKITYDKVTTYHAMTEICKPDWTGGVVVTSVDREAMKADHRETDAPRYLLQKEGWELLDPFIPIEVPKFTSQEIQTTIDYYLERKWLAHPRAGTTEGRLELEFLSTGNPETLRQLCNSR